MADPQFPPPAAGGPLILLKAKTYALIRQGLMRAILPDPLNFEVERSVAELKFRLRPSLALHPFQIFLQETATELRLLVNVGRAVTNSWQVIAGNTVPNIIDVPCQFSGGGELANDPFGAYGGNVGYSVLAASTTYGVWLVGGNAGGGGDSNTLEYQTIQGYAWNSLSVHVSSVYTLPSEAADVSEAVGASVACAAIFLGKVEVDSDKQGVITQYRRSDLVLPAPSLPEGFVADVADNDLQATRVDHPGLYVRVVSPDAGNSITRDSEGSAYYDAP
jgi:hypothetical protein